MKQKIIKNYTESLKKIIPYAIIFIASLVVCIPLMNAKINILYDDGIQHICRLMGTFQSITEGQTFPVIMSNFANGFGYSWNIFYSPITAYFPLVFKIFNISFVNCEKIFMFFVVFFSGITMYLFTKKISKKESISILSAILYIFAPYRLTDMYIRNAIAELTSFIFIPLVFMGLYKDEDNDINYKSLIIGATGLLLTHTVVTLYTAIFAIIYLILNVNNLKNIKTIKKLFLSGICILLLTSFYWAPMLEHKTNADYEVFKEGRMERTDVLVFYKLNLSELFVTNIESHGMIYELGIVTVLGLIISPIAIAKIRGENKIFYKSYLFYLISGICCLIMTLKIFPFEKLPAVLKMIQFTFRLLEFSSFFLSIVVAINIIKVFDKIKSIYIIIIISIILTVVSATYIRYFYFLEEEFDENKIWPAVKVTEQTR